MYIHIPFCTRRCGYCDFVTVAGQDKLIPAYLARLGNEIDHYARQIQEMGNHNVHTVFLGGGTPSRVDPGQIAQLLSRIKSGFPVEPDCEITIEANPGDLTSEYLSILADSGVNRLSIGVQSAQPGDLKVLDRSHGFEDVKAAVLTAQHSGFENISLDLIYGIPHQTMAGWEDTLRRMVSLETMHLSLYALTVEAGTPLETKISRGLVPMPDDDQSADMYELASSILVEHGFVQYEISNWARRDQSGRLLQSEHNRQYWLNDPYLGIGVGAHGYIKHVRYANTKKINAYIHQSGQQSNVDQFFFPACEDLEVIDGERQKQETMMMGLRLVREGVSSERFKQRFGEEMEDVFESEIGHWTRLGLLEWVFEGGKRLKLTEKGYLLSNQVFRDFVTL